MNTKILKLMENNARISIEDIATVTDLSPKEVESRIREMEESGIIKGYKTIIDREMLDENAVSATIELKVVPKAERGFEEVAQRIALYPEVESVSLMSGGCDLSVVVTGSTFKDVANFVSKELATIDAVTATSTQFIMKRYKDHGVCLTEDGCDRRDAVSL